MARRGGGLDLLTVVAIFAAVLLVMWAGVEHSRGDLLPDRSIDAPEREVRAALWEAVVEWRAGRGLEPPRRPAATDFDAQRLAEGFAAGNGSVETIGGVGLPEAGLQPSERERCAHVLVEHTLAAPGERALPSRAGAVARAVLSALVRADEDGVLERTGPFRTGIGVVADGADLYVVYRSCAGRRVSP